jgi:pyruvate formate lyase activating enzyme
MSNLTPEQQASYLATRGIVFNIQRFSIHDGPGIRTIVFLKGCPLRCQWCSNPESQDPKPALMFSQKKCISCGTCEQACPLKAISFKASPYPTIDRSICDNCGRCVEECCTQALYFEGRSESVEQVLAEVAKDRAFYENSGGGLTLSGGEVLAQPTFAYALLAAAQDMGLHTAIETTGFAQPEVLLKVVSKVDLILFDFKHYDSARHLEKTGVDNDLILENLKRLCEIRQPLVVRIPVIPGFNDSMEDAREFGRILSDLKVEEINLLPFHQLGEHKYDLLGKAYPYHGVKSIREENLAEYRQIMADFDLDVKIGG